MRAFPRTRSMWLVATIITLLIFLAVIALVISAPFLRTVPRILRLEPFLLQPAEHQDWLIVEGERCPDAPFQFPTRGYIGFLWGDSWSVLRRHTGLDIFSGGPPGVTPVYAAYAGFLTRLENWKSTLIIRIPSDPLVPTRQIWMYYTHLADGEGNSYISPDFPPGSTEIPVEAGQLLGLMGNYAGEQVAPTGVHLHFSLVRSDAEGSFLNESVLRNTLDPSPYFGRLLANPDPNQPLPPCQ